MCRKVGEFLGAVWLWRLLGFVVGFLVVGFVKVLCVGLGGLNGEVGLIIH